MSKINDFRVYLEKNEELFSGVGDLVTDRLQEWLYKNNLEIVSKPKSNATELHQRTLTPTFKSL